MSQRRTTVPPTHVSSRSPRSARKGLIAKDKNEKQSAKRRSALDNRFHRTDLPFSRAAPPGGDGRVARRLPRITICSEGAKCNRRDATALATAAAGNGAASAATAS